MVYNTQSNVFSPKLFIWNIKKKKKKRQEKNCFNALLIHVQDAEDTNIYKKQTTGLKKVKFTCLK